MLTWLRLWPLFFLPVLLLNLLGFCPTYFLEGEFLGGAVILKGTYIGGGPVREWTINTFFLPMLSPLRASDVIDWFLAASVAEEWVLYLVIVVTLDVLLLPGVYVLGNSLIRASNWLVLKELQLKRSAAR